MNHNLVNKITEEYIADRINKAIKEHNDKIYVYTLHYNLEKNYLNAIEAVKANNEKELLIKIFNKHMKFFIPCFFRHNIDIFKKYIPNIEKDITEKDITEFNHNWRCYINGISENYDNLVSYFVESFTDDDLVNNIEDMIYCFMKYCNHTMGHGYFFVEINKLIL